MPAKREVPDADYLINHYQSGEAMRQLLKERNISDCLFARLLRDRGIKRRSPQDSYVVRRGRIVEALQWIPDNPDAVLYRYSSGESLKSISDSLDTSRQAIGDWMRRQGVTLRGRSEAETLKWRCSWNIWY